MENIYTNEPIEFVSKDPEITLGRKNEWRKEQGGYMFLYFLAIVKCQIVFDSHFFFVKV